jgi:hypothetical protein
MAGYMMMVAGPILNETERVVVVVVATVHPKQATK